MNISTHKSLPTRHYSISFIKDLSTSRIHIKLLRPRCRAKNRAFASTINEFAVFVVKEEENRHFVGIGKRGKTGTKKDKGNKPIRPKRALQLPMHWQAFIFFRSSFFSFYGKAGGENSPFMGTVASSVKLLKTTVTPVIIKHIVQQ